MTLGEMIKTYTEEYSMTEFIKDAGISRAYAYLLIANKNKGGSPIVPTIEMIQKVSKGLHKNFDEVFNELDYDFVVKINSGGKKINDKERPEIKRLISLARKCDPEDLKIIILLLEKLSKK